MPSLYFFRPRECNHVKHVFLNNYFTLITVQRRSWSHTNARFLRKSRIPLFFFHIAFPNSSHFIIWFERWQCLTHTGPVDSHLPLKRMISQIYNIQAKTSRIPCLNFGESRLQGSLKILFRVKIFCVFTNPTPYVGQIPHPEKTLKTLFNSHLSKLSIVWRWGSELASWVNLDCKTTLIFA